MSNILKAIDLTDRAIRRAVFAVKELPPSNVPSVEQAIEAARAVWRASSLCNSACRQPNKWCADDNANRLFALAARAPCAQHGHVCGGYPIRRIHTRFGDIYAVIGTDSAFATLAQAEA